MNNNTLSPAGFLRRLAALIYDMLVLACIWFFATGLMVLINKGESLPAHHPLLTAYLLLVTFTFLAWCWIHGGQTLGMKAWKIRVQGINGEPLTWKTALIRYLVALVSLASLGLGFVWILFDGSKRSWYDRASGTCVVRSCQGNQGSR